MYLTEQDASTYLARAYSSADPTAIKDLLAPDVGWHPYGIVGKDKVWDYFYSMMDLMKLYKTPWPAEIVKAKIRKDCIDAEPFFGFLERDCVLLYPAWAYPKPMLLVVGTENDLIKRLDTCHPDHFILSGNTKPLDQDYRLNVPERFINEKSLSEYEAVVVYARACNDMDPTEFVELLSPYASYISFQVRHPLRGKEAISEYMFSVMENMGKSGIVLNAEVCRVFDDIKYILEPPEDGTHVRDCVMLKQDDIKEHDRLVLLEVKDGFITYIDILDPYRGGCCYQFSDHVLVPRP
jgi:hypothetical protein